MNHGETSDNVRTAALTETHDLVDFQLVDDYYQLFAELVQRRISKSILDLINSDLFESPIVILIVNLLDYHVFSVGFLSR